MTYKWTRRLAIATIPIMIVAIILAGGGHGTPIAMLIFYPISFAINEDLAHSLVWIIVLGQFPMYGLLIDYGIYRSRPLLAVGLILLVHVTLFLVVVNDQAFWDKWK